MPLPKFGASTDLFKSVLQGMKELDGYGFDFFEISIQEPYGTPGKLLKNQKQIKKFVEDNSLFLIGHPPHWGEIASLHDGIRKAWLDEYKRMIEVSQKVGVQKLVTHAHIKRNRKTGKPFEKEIMRRNIESLTEINDYARDHGVTIVLENLTRKKDVFGFEDFKYLVDSVKDVKVIVDVGHAYIYYGMDNVFRYLKGFKKKIDHIHFHDNNGSADEHLPIGVGNIDYESVVRYLKKIKYDKTIAFEVFVKNMDYLRMSVDIVKRMWK